MEHGRHEEGLFVGAKPIRKLELAGVGGSKGRDLVTRLSRLLLTRDVPPCAASERR
jgi:hypothetical protein